MDQDAVFSPTILDSARRHPFLTAGFAVAFGLLALAASRLVFNDWVAEASVLIQDPSATQVFDTGTSSQPERYLASQVAVLESREMAETAHDLVPGNDMTVRSILDSRRVITTGNADLIVIAFQHPDPERALLFANAYGEAYVSYRDALTTAAYDAALAGLNESISAVDQELESIDESIEGLTSVGDDQEIEERLLQEIQNFLGSPTGTAAEDRLEAVVTQLQALQALRSLESQSQGVALLLESRSHVLERRSQLVIRRDQLRVDAQLASNGIVSVSDATEAERSLATGQVIVLGLIIGAIMGVAVSHYMVRRNRRFEGRSEPESILGIPLLAEVPAFPPRASHALPVLYEPSSPEAEAFRFASSAITARLTQNRSATDHRGRPISESASTGRSVVVTSALLGAGKTVVSMNAGLSAATRGASVLIVDADFGDPALSRNLIGDLTDVKGITNVLEEEALLSDVVVPVNLGEDHRVDLLPRGTSQISAVDFFSSPQTRALVRQLKSKYDHILIDAPPLLQVAYASSVVSLADVVVLVIPHEGPVAIHQELVNRLDLLGSQVLGYIYNKAPRRAELFERRGSMLDPLGTGTAGKRP